MVTLSHVHLWQGPQQMPREEHGNTASTMKPSCPSYHPPSLSPPPAQDIASSGLPREDKAEIVSPTDVVLWLAPHHISVMFEGHSPVCRIPAGEALGLALVCSPHKSHPDCKRHPQKGLKPFAITESCSAITNTKTQLKLSS